MTRIQRQAVLLALIQRLRENGSWCGETHIQKSACFLQELLGVPLDFNMIFYKHGPYAFDLSDELTALRGDLLLSVQSREPYGPSLSLTEQGQRLLDRFPTTLKTHEGAIRFVAERLGPKKVIELERLATALYVLREMPDATSVERSRNINRLKPHVSYEEALAALQAVEGMRAELKVLDSP
jgi:uncharacterized protein YwgA